MHRKLALVVVLLVVAAVVAACDFSTTVNTDTSQDGRLTTSPTIPGAEDTTTTTTAPPTDAQGRVIEFREIIDGPAVSQLTIRLSNSAVGSIFAVVLASANGPEVATVRASVTVRVPDGGPVASFRGGSERSYQFEGLQVGTTTATFAFPIDGGELGGTLQVVVEP